VQAQAKALLPAGLASGLSRLLRDSLPGGGLTVLGDPASFHALVELASESSPRPDRARGQVEGQAQGQVVYACASCGAGCNSRGAPFHALVTTRAPVLPR